jgi:hypothetical protein
MHYNVYDFFFHTVLTDMFRPVFRLFQDDRMTGTKPYKLDELCQHHCACDKIEKNEMGGACSSDGEGRGVYRVLVGKLE